MSQKEVFLQQFFAVNSENWFVPVKFALEGLTAEQALKKDSSTHSIWEILNHLIYWNERQLNMFKGIPNPEHEPDNDSTFINDSRKVSEEEWKSAVNKIQSIFSEWENEIKKADDAKFESDFRGDPMYSFLANVTIHNAYHIGQIVQIRKQNGSWDSKLGVS